MFRPPGRVIAFIVSIRKPKAAAPRSVVVPEVSPMSEWILATALLFLMGLGLGARPDGRAPAAAAASRTGDRPGADAG